MRTLRAFAVQFLSLFRKRRHEDDFDAELESHLDIHTDAGIRAGLTPAEARRQALIALGGAEQTRQAHRERRTVPWLENMLQDILYSLRTLRRSPGFSLTVVLTFALGVGATTAVFSLVYSILLRPLPYQQSGRLVSIWEQVRYLKLDRPYLEANPRHAQYWKQQATYFSDLTVLRQGTAGISQSDGHPRIVGVVRSYTNLFSVLGVQPELGRAFLAEEGTVGHDRVAIITHDVWQQTLAGDPQVLGKPIRVNGNLLQVVGVLPESFHFPKGNVLSSQQGETGAWPSIGVFVPLIIDQSKYSLDGDFNFIVLGRLKNGISLEQATSQLNTIDETILREYGAASNTKLQAEDLRAYVLPLQEAVVGPVATMLWLLLASVSTVLLIACVNLANLQLGRAIRREKEFSVRTALGASPFRLLATALYESLLLSVLGGLTGILLAKLAIRFFLQNAPIDLPRLDEVGINFWVMGFGLAVSVLTGIGFGILPALKALHVDPQVALQTNGNRSMGSHGATHTRSWLIGIEVFAATALLMVMGLLDQSLLHLLNQHRGFATTQVFSAEVDVDGHRYVEDASRAAFDDEILRRLRSLPGVQAVGLVSAMPLNGESWLDGIFRTDRPHSDSVISNYRWISPDYLSTVRVPLLMGRLLTEADRNRKVALISDYTAKTVWPGEDPIGRQFRRGEATYTVTGIVADTRSNSLKDPPGLMVYMPYWDNPPYATFFMVRTAQQPTAIAEEMRRQIWSYDPDANIAQMHSLDRQVNESLAPERSQVVVLSSFGAAALCLAMIGIYGVLSYSVTRRVNELGIRIALGASRRSIYVLTMTQAAAPVLSGLVGGIILGILAGYLIRSLLYGTYPVDGPVTVLVCTGFLAVASLAAYLPARRAASINPIEALRVE